jgi:hypothetical protein
MDLRSWWEASTTNMVTVEVYLVLVRTWNSWDSHGAGRNACHTTLETILTVSVLWWNLQLPWHQKRHQLCSYKGAPQAIPRWDQLGLQ